MQTIILVISIIITVTVLPRPSDALCGQPGKSRRSYIIEGELKNRRLYETGNEITYECDPPSGNLLVGNWKRKCQANGVWSGKIPKCGRLLVIFQ